ncbi:hypothetical protein KG090_02430 [Carnobacteriaceae bacterium zg-ZUI240]|nr:hypothetical protein [Carnobacteriaceae bacterium zg-ZUI240]
MRIGIDAGGTKTTGLLFDEQHQVVATAKEAMGNVLVDYDEAYKNIRQCIQQLKTQTDKAIDCISVGAAGVSVMVDKLQTALENDFNTRVVVKTDVQMSHIATFQNEDGVLLIAGTGSVALDKTNGEFQQRGGWGHLLGDEGSAYWIAKQIVLTYIRYLETNEMPAGFETYVEQLKEKLPDRQAIINLVYRRTKDEVAELAQLLDGSKESDYTNELVQSVASHLVNLILGHSSKKDVTVAFEGGVITKNEAVLKATMTQLETNCHHVNVIEKQNGAYAVLYV